MGLQNSNYQQNCPREEIFLYLEGELAAADELSLEGHFADCSICLTEFKSQKELFRTLKCAFDNETEIEPPKDFTKIVVAKAESNVKGLRCRKERTNAIFLCCALFLILAIGFGAETENGFAIASEFGKQFFAVFGFASHLIYDISLGIVVILRSLVQQPSFTPIISLILVIGFGILSFYALNRLKLRFSRS
jgi:predicted anti-sigma-YlaC factor YlaD